MSICSQDWWQYPQLILIVKSLHKEMVWVIAEKIDSAPVALVYLEKAGDRGGGVSLICSQGEQLG